MHFGCVEACKPSPVESKCVTACEAKMYGCIDHTGPNETPEDTEKCQSEVLKLYTQKKGAETAVKKNEEKKEKKGLLQKAKAFLQIKNIDDENAEAAEMARLEDQSDKEMGEDDSSDEADADSSSEDETGDAGMDASFVQMKRLKSKNIDDENAEAAEMARLEDESDKEMGEDDSSDEDDAGETGFDSSFIQIKSQNIDDENAQAAEMAR